MKQNNLDTEQIVYEIYKLRSAVLPEKNTWSIDEISERLSAEYQISRSELDDRLKVILKELEDKQAIIFINGFKAFSLVEPKLLEFLNASKSKQTN